jgi:predicted transcriptional regulator
MAKSPRALSPLEQEVMTVVWDSGPSSAEAIGGALRRPLTNASVRTVLRRLESKGYLRHRVDGRTFIYESRIGPGAAVSGAVRRIIDRLCGGSAARLLLGLLDEGVIDQRELRDLERQLAERRKEKP